MIAAGCCGDIWVLTGMRCLNTASALVSLGSIKASGERELLKTADKDFPSGPVFKTVHFQCKGCGFDPWLGNQDPTCHAAPPKVDNMFHPFSFIYLKNGIKFNLVGINKRWADISLKEK